MNIHDFWSLFFAAAYFISWYFLYKRVDQIDEAQERLRILLVETRGRVSVCENKLETRLNLHLYAPTMHVLDPDAARGMKEKMNELAKNKETNND